MFNYQKSDLRDFLANFTVYEAERAKENADKIQELRQKLDQLPSGELVWEVLEMDKFLDTMNQEHEAKTKKVQQLLRLYAELTGELDCEKVEFWTRVGVRSDTKVKAVIAVALDGRQYRESMRMTDSTKDMRTLKWMCVALTSIKEQISETANA